MMERAGGVVPGGVPRGAACCPTRRTLTCGAAPELIGSHS